jgi:hypothetical protein
MSIDLIPWPRTRFEPGGGDALIFFALYGNFSAEVEIPGATYRTGGRPEGIDIRKLKRAHSPEFPFTSGSIKDLLQPKQPDLSAQLESVPECLIIQGMIPDPPNLDYLRDTIGVATYFLENGGVAIIDPQQLKLYDGERWRKEIFEPQPPELNNHVVILFTEETDGTGWYHTRGLRKFGRPDLSCHHAPRQYEGAVLEMFKHFILSQVEGALIPEGHEIRMGSLPSLTCHHSGRDDDPGFNNRHIEIAWPDGAPRV